MALVYEANPKHKHPWQHGARGSLCPDDLTPDDALGLLRDSVEVDHKRYATDGQRAFCAQMHAPDTWHGYPVGWKEVPESIRRQWVADGAVKRRSIRSNWDGSL